jgi:hypothetical protein
MGTLWLLHRRRVLLALAAVVIVAAGGIALVARVSPSPKTPAAISPRPGAAPRPSPDATPPSAPTRSRYRPPRAQPAASAAQAQTDQRLAEAETPDALAAAAATPVPTPADSAAYRPVAVADLNDPTAYALAFATELLDRDYARQSRTQLLAWAQAEEAPNTLPGVPSPLADKALVLSLAAPGLPGGSTSSPVPSAGEWINLAQAHTTQSVSGLQVQVDPDWTGLVSSGWQPVDPAMTIMAVTGTLTTDQAGRTSTRSFALAVTLGSARSRPGYGAVAVDDWTVN